MSARRWLRGLSSLLACSGTACSPTGATDDANDSEDVSTLPAPDQPGPFTVGTHEFAWHDDVRDRDVTTQVWYPSEATGAPVRYLDLMEGTALAEAPFDTSAGRRPVVLFSHGFQGIDVQSFSILEHVASHGYIVAAPDHAGNTLFDGGASDEQIARVSLDRPADMQLALARLLEEDGPSGWFPGGVDHTRVVATGHSFGGWTALMLAGAVLDVDAAVASCEAGAPSDIFCDYIPYFPAHAMISVDPPVEGLVAAVYFAPGGYSSFGPTGLTHVRVPSLVFGGTLDDTTPLDVEITPTYAGLPEPKAEAVLRDASHFSFTDLCGLSIADAFLRDFCVIPGLLDARVAAHDTAALTVAWLRLWVDQDPSMEAWLESEAVTARMPDVELQRSGF